MHLDGGWRTRAWLLAILLGGSSVCWGDEFVFKQAGKERKITGKMLVEAQDGAMMAVGQDGFIWSIQPDELVSHKPTGEAFAPFDQTKLIEELTRELPAGFRFHTTKHYVIGYNTSEAYAEWCGALFERLFMAFTNYWRQKQFPLTEPQYPMVALVFADRDSFALYARPELGDAVENIIGYYSFRSNRMTTHDLTGIEALRAPGDRGKASDINRILSRPQAERTVATIIHEATHQIAYNCGLQTRYADNPLWVSEGMALYFETPDLQSKSGWRSIGSVNQFQLARFVDYAQRRRAAGSLQSLLTDDKRLRDPRQSTDAYAEAWALNYFLMQTRTKQYHEYLKRLSEKPVCIWDKPEQRLEDFKQSFGDLDGLDRDFLRYSSRWLRR